MYIRINDFDVLFTIFCILIKSMAPNSKPKNMGFTICFLKEIFGKMIAVAEVILFLPCFLSLYYTLRAFQNQFLYVFKQRFFGVFLDLFC